MCRWSACLRWKVQFRKMLSVILTYKPWLSICHVDLTISNCAKFYWNVSTHSADWWENASQSDYFTVSGLAVTFVLELWHQNYFNQFIFVPNCSEVLSLLTFPREFCKISCSQPSVHDHVYERTAPKNIMLSVFSAGDGIKIRLNVLFKMYTFYVFIISHNFAQLYFKIF